jgi:membrane protease YdiL (CAAX protease family)
VALNAVVFAIAHMVYDSWVSILLALAGRVIMARIYRRHGNFWGVWLIHVLFGVAVFLVGLGRYFYRPVG